MEGRGEDADAADAFSHIIAFLNAVWVDYRKALFYEYMERYNRMWF